MGEINGRAEERQEARRTWGMSGHIQGLRDVRGGSQGRGKNQSHHQNSLRTYLVHPRGLGTWRSQNQERGQGRDGRGTFSCQESQEGDCSKVIFMTIMNFIVFVVITMLSFRCIYFAYLSCKWNMCLKETLIVAK